MAYQSRLSMLLTIGLFAANIITSNTTLANDHPAATVDLQSDCWFFCYTIPRLGDALEEIGDSQNQSLQPGSFSTLIWNIYKAGKSGFAKDFTQIAKNADLTLIQEAVLNEKTKKPISPLLNRAWYFAKSFLYESDSLSTGVMTGSKAATTESIALRSPDREPFSNTPKMALVTTYPIEGQTDELMIVNFHGINFNPKIYGALMSQLKTTEKIVKSHNGPVVFAGDFNTWSADRKYLVDQFMRDAELSPVHFVSDRRNQRLDHVYYRNLKVKKSKILDDIQSSDHWPLIVEFGLDLGDARE